MSETLKGEAGARQIVDDAIRELRHAGHGERLVRLVARDGQIVHAEVTETRKYKLD